MKNNKEINLKLKDTEWKFSYVDHKREIVRAIVFDENKNFYFVKCTRDDAFGKVTLIETAGGGVEEGEILEEAIKRELKEELGVNVDILCKIGVVSDYYNLIHRNNINNYYLCKIKSFSKKSLTQSEKEEFNLTTLKLNYEDAIREYIKCSKNKLGKLIANRELPVLKKAKELLKA